MNWPEFLQSDEFRAFRRNQAEEIATTIMADMRQAINGANPDFVLQCTGKLSMAKRLLSLPESLISDKGVKENVKRQMLEDLANLSDFLVRKHVLD